MGPIEEAGQTARRVVDRISPVTLAMILTNICLLAFMFYWAVAINSARQESIKLILDVHKQVNDILSRCVVPESRRSGLQIENAPLVPLPIPFPGQKEH